MSGRDGLNVVRSHGMEPIRRPAVARGHSGGLNLLHGRVDFRRGDRTLLSAPLFQDFGVLAIGHDRLDRLQHRLGQAAVLGNDNAVGRGVVGHTRKLELAARFLDDPRRHRRVGHAHLRAAAVHSQAGGVLVGIELHVHAFLARSLAFLVLLGGVFGLNRALGHSHAQSAQISQRGNRGATLGLDVKGGASSEITDEVHHLLALFGDGERRHAQVIPVRLQPRNDGVKTSLDKLGLDAQFFCNGVGQIDVEADHGLAVIGDELHGRVGGIEGKGQFALLLVLGGQGDRGRRSRRGQGHADCDCAKGGQAAAERGEASENANHHSIPKLMGIREEDPGRASADTVAALPQVGFFCRPGAGHQVLSGRLHSLAARVLTARPG